MSRPTTSWASPDDPFHASAWSSSPADSASSGTHSIMPNNNGSDESSTPDFAFEPPAMESSSAQAFDGSIKTPTYANSNTTFTPASFAYPSSLGYSSASSFSSTSGSASGTSFSSVDALPAISRDFARPNSSETRRPATAGGALQSSFGMLGEKRDKPETIDEQAELFTDPFAEKDDRLVPSQSASAMDPHFVPPNRRASEGQFQQPLHIQTNWHVTPDHSANPSPHQSFPLTSAPPNVTQFMPGPNIHTQMQHINRQNTMAYSSRPQTSDGLPSYGHIGPTGVSLPSARTLVNQINSPSTMTPQSAPYYGQPGVMPYRDNRAASLGEIQGSQAAQQYHANRHYSMSGADRFNQGDKNAELTFVSLGGPTPKKRPRRRYDEIERLYLCGWSGCEKSYGTLNHLNAHVAMQKHGDKRLPAEFKDMRKQWRKKKRDQAAVAANAQYMATTHTWNPRQSVSSGSDYDRRDSTTSNFSANSDYSHRGSMVYGGNYPFDSSSRPTTGSSVASSADGRFVSMAPQAGGYAHGMINPAPAVRRPSAPGHMAIPPSAQGFRPEDLPTPTQQNPYPRPGSSTAAFPFQTLTGPMPMMAGSTTGQFAFQR